MDPKIEAIREAVSLGDFIHRRVNSPRGWTKTAQKDLERSMRGVLTVVLGRKPTREEVEAAAAD